MENTIQQINTRFKNTLKNLYSKAETQQILFILFEKTLGLSRLNILTNPNLIIDAKKIKKLETSILRLLENEPIQYILGETEFFDLAFNVNKAVLIPRQETEELVHWIVTDNTNKGNKVLDIGTGSGCIAVSLAKNLDSSEVYAIDISAEALKTASINAKQNKVSVNFIKADILKTDLSYLPNEIDILVSNPPYVTHSEKTLMQPNVLNYEPDLALFVSDNDPLIYYKKLAELGQKILNKNGRIYFEINEAFGNQIKEMLLFKNYREIEIKQDLNGKDRMAKALK